MAIKTISIFGEVFPDAEFFGGTSFASFREEFTSNIESDDVAVIEIFSPGGSVIEGLAIYDFLRASKNKIVTKIIGLAGSIASVIALAGDEREITENAEFFIHNPSTFAEGDAEDLLEQAQQVARMETRIRDIYLSFSSDLSKQEIDDLMKNETTFTADEALAAGFVTSIIEPVRAVALTNKFDSKMKKSKSLIDRISNFLNQAEEKSPTTALMVTNSDGESFELETEVVEEGMEVELADGTYTTENDETFEVAEGVVTSVGAPEEEAEELEAKIDKLLESVENVQKENESLKETNSKLNEEITNLKKFTSSKKVPSKAVGTVNHQAVETGQDPEQKRRPFGAGGLWAEKLADIKERHTKTIKMIRKAG